MSADQRIQHVFQGLSRRSPLLCLHFIIVTGLCASAFGQSATSTVLATSPSVKAGTAVSFVATVLAGGQPVTSGQVQLCDATAKYCMGSAILGKAQLTATGLASGRFLLGIGEYSIKAVYQGTSQFAASSSAVVATVVNGVRATSTTLAISGNAGNYTLTSTVTGTGLLPLTGTVSFPDYAQGNLQLGAATLGSSQTTRSFTGLGTASTGSTPQSVVVGDFNGDGIPDVATANVNSNTISVLLGNGNGQFSLVNSTPQTGSNPAAIVAADFNNDGKLDLAVSNSNDNTVKIFLGNGDGTFVAGQSFQTGTYPGSMVTGDFNRDGQIDLAVLSQGDLTVRILLGSGNGFFNLAPNPSSSGSLPVSMASGDFNSDGIADLVVVNGDSTVTVLFGNGNGSFVTGPPLINLGAASAVAIGDFNGDGQLDLAVTSAAAQTVTIFLGNGQGSFSDTFQPLITDQQPTSVTVGDFNGDGVQDVAVGSSGANAIDLYLGRGDGTFAAKTVIPAGSNPVGATAVDANGDGLEDIVVADAAGNQARLLLNGASTVASASLAGVLAPGPSPQVLAASYLGDANYAASKSAASSVVGTQFATTITATTGATNIATGEPVLITGQISPSAYGSRAATGQVVLYDQNATITGAPVVDGTVSFNLSYPATGSHSYVLVYSGDSYFLSSGSAPLTVNVANANASSTTLAVSASSVPHGTVVTLTAKVMSGGAGVSRGRVNFCQASARHCTDAAILASAQVTAAGTATARLALPVGNNSIQAVFTGTGLLKSSTSGAQTVTVTGTYPLTVALTSTGVQGNYNLQATLTGAGKQSLSGQTVNLVDSSNHNFSLGSLPASSPLFNLVQKGFAGTGLNPFPVATGDFNGDGKADVAIGNYNAGTVSILLGNGDGTFAAAATLKLAIAISMVTGDFNGDGNLDLAVADAADNVVLVMLGDGKGNFSLKSTSPTQATPGALVAGDFNGDGIQDLAVLNYGLSNSVTMLLGRGDGTFLSQLATTPLPGHPGAMAAADFNSDGNLDLVVATEAGLVVLSGTGDGAFSSSVVNSLIQSPDATVISADFNADGRPDIAVTGGSQLFVLLNQGAGVFTATPQHLTTGYITGFIGIAVADLNGDGLPDVITSSTDGTVTVSYSAGSGNFNQTVQQLNAGELTGLAVADFDLDGVPDLIVNEVAANTSAVFLSRSIGRVTFSSVAVPGPGRHQVQATVAGIGILTSGISNALTLDGTSLTTNVLVSASPGPLVGIGQTVNVSVKVATDANYAPTGTVSLFEDSTLVKTASLVNGVITVPFTLSAAGTYNFTATYSGDVNLLATTSLVTPVYVTGASSTTLALSSNQSALGQPVTLTSTTVKASGGSAIVGVVRFCDAGAALCENSALLGTAEVNDQGKASTKVLLGLGVHRIAAVFQGALGQGFGPRGLIRISPSVSAPQVLTVTGVQATTTQLTSSGNSGSYNLTATVNGKGVQGVSGTVSFQNVSGNVKLGQASLGGATTHLAFTPSTVPALGGIPFQVAVGDFNNDGNQDAVFADQNDGAVTIALGNGQGGFSLQTKVTPLPGFESLVVADFNHDGNLDLALGSRTFAYVAVLLGNGDGTFGLVDYVPAPTGTYSMAVGDFNHDGFLDLFVSNPLDHSVSILLADINQNSFQGVAFILSTIKLPGGSQPAGVTMADFNGDGNLDAAVAITSATDNTGGVLIFLGDGAGTFTLSATPVTAGTNPISIVSADFNGDGKADLAVVNQTSTNVSILLGNGDGTFTVGPTLAVGSQPLGIAAADLNLDGNIDLAVSSQNSNNVTLLLGNGQGGFTTQIAAIPGSFQQGVLALADFNNDGKVDLLVPNQKSNAAELLLNNLTTTATATLTGVTATAGQTVSASYSGTTTYTASTSNTMTLAP